MPFYRSMAALLALCFFANIAHADGPFSLSLPKIEDWWPGERSANPEPERDPEVVIGLPDYRQPSEPKEGLWIFNQFDAGMENIKTGTQTLYQNTRRALTFPWNREESLPPRPATLGNPNRLR